MQGSDNHDSNLVREEVKVTQTVVQVQKRRCACGWSEDKLRGFLRRHEYPTWRCCELHSGEEPGETVPQSVYPKCSALPTGDWFAQQQHECCTPKPLDYAVREWVCGAGTYQYATANAAKLKEEKQWTVKERYCSGKRCNEPDFPSASPLGMWFPIFLRVTR